MESPMKRGLKATDSISAESVVTTDAMESPMKRGLKGSANSAADQHQGVGMQWNPR